MQFEHLNGIGIAVHYFGNILNFSTFPPDYVASHPQRLLSL